jgi:multimeric flavodoxin WrbA
MRIVVLGGSPKGETSVTWQYVRWIEENMPAHEVRTLQIASRIAALERDEAKFAEAIEAVREADAVLWAFPLYVFTVCSQYKRFIELIWEKGVAGAFAGKYAGSLSTSIHFFDHTAHRYVREVSEDLGMAFVGSFSPAMFDLHKKECRRQLLLFAEGLADSAERKLPIPRQSAPLARHEPPLASEPGPGGFRKSAADGAATGKKALVLVDYPELAVGSMARRFAVAAASTGARAEVLALADMGMKGGCLGCLKCGQANVCAYEGKDGFIDAFRSKVMTADLLVFAGTIRDRALSARWKAFFDRAFFNTHQSVLKGKQFLFLVSGPLSRLDNLRQTLQGYVEWQGGNLVDFVSDEVGSAPELDALLDGAASRCASALASGEMKGATFLGLAGMKVFRDEIYGHLRIVFKGDHRAYRRNGVYDFPQRNPLETLAVWLGYWISSIPVVYRGIISNLPSLMIRQFEPLFARARETAKMNASREGVRPRASAR